MKSATALSVPNHAVKSLLTILSVSSVDTRLPLEFEIGIEARSKDMVWKSIRPNPLRMLVWASLAFLCLNSALFLGVPSTFRLRRMFTARENLDDSEAADIDWPSSITILCRAVGEKHRQRPVPAICAKEKGIQDYQNFCCTDREHRPGGNYLPLSDDLPLRRGTFLYLVQGEGIPSEFWREVSQRSDSSIIWLSWRKSVPIDDRLDTFSRWIFCPNSTYNTGRNRLITGGQRLEFHQGWRFEFFVVADEDQEMMTISNSSQLKHAADHLKNITFPGKDAFPKSIAVLNYLLLTYRPARAGVFFQYKSNSPLGRWACVNTPYTDLALDAYHRTAMSAMLPYDLKYDAINGYFSTAVSSMKAHLLLGQYAVRFQVLVNYPESKGQKHANYPKTTKYGRRAFCYIARCLWPFSDRAAELFPNGNSSNLKRSTDTTQLSWRQQDGLLYPCLRLPSTVDYSKVVNYQTARENWFR